MAKFQPDNAPNWLQNWWDREFYQNGTLGIAEDDCAIMNFGEEQLVVTMDYLNSRPIIMEFGISKMEDLGYLLVNSSISDLAGSGAKPIGFLVGAMMERKSTKKDFKKLMNGVKMCLQIYKIPLIGGDTKLGDKLALNGVAIGIAKDGSKLFPSSGAEFGDEIWISGNIGMVGSALAIYRNTPSLELKEWCENVIKYPKVPLSISLEIATKRIGNGGTDLSDGLSTDLRDLCRNSNLGCIIDVEQIPVHEKTKEIGQQLNIEAWIFGMVMGGDSQFVVTSSVENHILMNSIGMIKIGEITKSKGCFLKLNQKVFEMPSLGHEDGRRISFEEELTLLANKVKDYIND